MFWRGTEALMVRSIPAVFCTRCGEEFVSEATATELERIRAAGFNGSGPEAWVSIPVFSFGRTSGGAGQ